MTLASSGDTTTASVAGGPYAIVPSAATGGSFNAGNYSISYVNGVLSVTPAPLTIAAKDQSQTYGAPFVFAGTEFTPTGLKNGETVGSVTLTSSGDTATASVAGGPYAIVPSSPTGGTFSASNYNISLANGALTVTPAPLTITAANQSHPYGLPLVFAGTEFTPTGLQNGETVGSVTLVSSGNTATASAAGGPYGIAPAAATGGSFDPGNYSISYVNGALTVNPASLTIAAMNQSQTYASPFVFTGNEFTARGLKNGETVGSVTLASPGDTATAGVAGNPYAIVPSAANGGTFVPGNYNISYVNGALTVNPASLTLTAKNQTQIYGSPFVFAGSEFTASGLKNGDMVGAVTFASAGDTATASVAGGPYAIVPSAATGGTFTPGNYSIAYANGSLSVTPAALTITAKSESQTYGSPFVFTGSEFTQSGLKNGETVGSVTLASSGDTATASVAGGPYAIVPSAANGGSFSAGNYSISYVNGALTVNPAPLTITAQNQSQTYGSPFVFTGSEFTPSGLKNGEAVGSVALNSIGDTPTAGVAGSPYAIVPSAATGGTFTASNYAIGFANGSLTVNPAPLLITTNNASRLYGADNPAFTASFSGLVNGETPSVITGLELGTTAPKEIDIGAYPIFVFGGVNPNYTISTRFGRLLVNPAPLTIVANDASRLYGAANPIFTAEFTGLVNGDTPSSILDFALTTTAGPNAAALGRYAITPSGKDSNYNIKFINGTLTVDPAPLTITAKNETHPYGSPFAFTGKEFTARGLANGEMIGPLTLATAGNTPTAPVAGGPYTIVPSAASALGAFDPNNYTIAYVNGSLSVTPAPLTITANSVSHVYGSPVASNGFQYTASGLENGETVGSVTVIGPVDTATISVAGGPYAILPTAATGGTFDPSNYSINYVIGFLDVTPAPLTIKALNQTQTYGSPFAFLPPGSNSSQFTVSGLVNGERIGSVKLTSAGDIATSGVTSSPYPIVPAGAAGGTFAASNYAITYSNGALTVLPAPLTVTADNVTRVANTPNPVFTAHFSGLLNGDTSAVVSGLGFTTTGGITSLAGAFPIVPSGGAAANYKITRLVNGTLTITPTPVPPVVNTTPATITTTTSGDTTLTTISVTGPTTLSATPVTPTNQTPLVVCGTGCLSLGNGPQQAEFDSIIKNFVTEMAGITTPPVTSASIYQALADPTSSTQMMGTLLPFIYTDLSNILNLPQSQWTAQQTSFVQAVQNYIQTQRQAAAQQAMADYQAWVATQQEAAATVINAQSGQEAVIMASVLATNPPIPPQSLLQEVGLGMSMSAGQLGTYAALTVQANQALSDVSDLQAGASVTGFIPGAVAETGRLVGAVGAGLTKANIFLVKVAPVLEKVLPGAANIIRKAVKAGRAGISLAETGASAIPVVGEIVDIVGTVVEIGMALGQYSAIKSFNKSFGQAVTQAEQPFTVNDLKAMVSSPTGGQQLFTYLGAMAATNGNPPPVAKPTQSLADIIKSSTAL